MEAKSLERELANVQVSGKHTTTIDLYMTGRVRMYTGDIKPPLFMPGNPFEKPLTENTVETPTYLKPLGELTFEGTDKGTSFKIFDDEKGGAPLLRYDLKGHHGMPEKHLQYDKKLFTGRSGDEAAEIVADIFVNNPLLKMPWDKND